MDNIFHFFFVNNNLNFIVAFLCSYERHFKGGGGGRGGGHTVSHPGYLHRLLQMFGPENGVCNYYDYQLSKA